MKKKSLNKNVFIQLDSRSLWQYYSSISGVVKGGGNTQHPKLKPSAKRMYKDLVLASEIQSREEIILPNLFGGISFADSVETLETKGITGHVWKIPKSTILPDGLIFNVKDYDHPMLNVAYQMPKSEFLVKLEQLSKKLIKTNHVIKR